MSDGRKNVTSAKNRNRKGKVLENVVVVVIGRFARINKSSDACFYVLRSFLK